MVDGDVKVELQGHDDPVRLGFGAVAVGFRVPQAEVRFLGVEPEAGDGLCRL